MRQIKEMIKVIRLILVGRNQPEEESNTIEHSQIEGLQKLAIRLADKGRINEAENLLFDKIDSSDIDQFYMLLAFYEHISDYPDEFLKNCDYRREEIVQGIADISNRYGVSKPVLELLMGEEMLGTLV